MAPGGGGGGVFTCECLGPNGVVVALARHQSLTEHIHDLIRKDQIEVEIRIGHINNIYMESALEGQLTVYT